MVLPKQTSTLCDRDFSIHTSIPEHYSYLADITLACTSNHQTMESSTLSPSGRDLLPTQLSALILNHTFENNVIDTTINATPATVHSHLSRISRSTWLHLGADCHNKSFAADSIQYQATSTPAVKSYVSSMRPKEVRVNLESGIPQIIHTIYQRINPHTRSVNDINTIDGMKGDEVKREQEQEQTPALWQLFNFCKTTYAQAQSSTLAPQEQQKPPSSRDTRHTRNQPRQQRHGSTTAPWQLFFLRTGCPEIVITAALDLFLKQGLKQGFDWIVSQELIETLDHELCSSDATAKKAVQALIQTMISSSRFVKTSLASTSSLATAANTGGFVCPTKVGSAGQGLTLGFESMQNPSADTSTAGLEAPELLVEKRNRACFQIASILSDAYSAFEAYLETEEGKSLPKLVALLGQEVTADTKARSRSGLAERGTKRPGIAGISGVNAATGQDALDLAAKKKLKLGAVENANPIGSALITSSKQRQTDVPSPVPSGVRLSATASSSVSSGYSADQIAALARSSFRSSTHYLEQAQIGYNTSATGGTGGQAGAGGSGLTSLVSAQSNLNMSPLQQAKVNNPLWSPALGLNYSIQQQAKYGPLIVNEIERWMTYLSHVDGAVFSERLVGLIKAIYPSDQKFLLDQILIEAMALETKDNRYGSSGSGLNGQDHLEEIDPKSVLLSSLSTPFYVDSHSPAILEAPLSESIQGNELKKSRSQEWLVEMIMSALVSLVIKPEDSAAWIEAGATKWAEVVDLSTIVTPEDPAHGSTTVSDALYSAKLVGTGHAGAGASAAGMPKKRRLRSLYNRRVSPFYAILAIFQQKKAAARMTGMFYLTPEDIEALHKDTADALMEQRKQQELIMQQHQELLQQAQARRRDKDLDLDDPNKATYKLSKSSKRRPNRRLTSKKSGTGSGSRGGGGGGSVSGPGQHGRKGRQSIQLEASVDRDMTDGAILVSETKLEVPSEAAIDGTGDTNMGHSHQVSKVHEENKEDIKMEEEDEHPEQQHQHQHQQQQQKQEDQHPLDEFAEHDAESDLLGQDGWMEGFTDDQALALAKEAGAGRQTCNAPFWVLMRILKHLTRMNQAGGALDAWISDAISGTAPALQIRYFEWLLSHLVPIGAVLTKPKAKSGERAMISESAENKNDAHWRQLRWYQHQVRAAKVIQEEVWRLVKVLVTAQGIGREPVKTALATVASNLGQIVTSKKKSLMENGSDMVVEDINTGVDGDDEGLWDEVQKFFLDEEPAATGSINT
ncbi:hypothetical protein BG004_006032 [Podila humilis]|nr:hypothetical protein BG004_006032 [Podila humilis]